jgi:hypothetical protein
MISPNRSPEKKHTDASDFISIVRNSYDDIDLNKLRKFGEVVYKGGGSEIVQYVEDAKAGRTLQV